MPKTTLTIDENKELYEVMLDSDRVLLQTGLTSSAQMSVQDLTRYYKLGGDILSKEGFAVFYEGQTISAKLQEEID